MMGIMALALAAATLSSNAAAPHWLYVVKSKSTDPAREADYNRWYSTIDVPDVLAVPGFDRARRAVASDRTQFSPAYQADGDYAALYDIRSANIDKTIIDLYVGARRMTWRGRTTDLLKVTEANYYRTVWDKARAAAVPSNRPNVLLAKINCCRNAADRDRTQRRLALFAQHSLARDPPIFRIAVYDLYRVMEVEAVPPSEVPHLLVVVESRTAEAGTNWLAALRRDARMAVADDSREYSIFQTEQADRTR